MKLSLVIIAVIIVAAIVATISLTLASQVKPTYSTSINLKPEYSQIESTGVENLTSGSWPMYHHDLAHTGLAKLTVNKSIRQNWSSPSLDGAVYAEPLVNGNSVFVATENNSIYSLDAQNGAIQWRLHLGQPVPAQELPCGNIDPSGITGTPVIDTSTRTLYAVIFLNTSPPQHDLVAVDINTGKGLRTLHIDPPGSDPTVEQQRAALTISNGTVYVPFGGLYGDCGNYHGYMVGSKNDTGVDYVYQVPTEREGGFWAQSGPVVDDLGYLYITSGNGASTDKFDHGNTLIKLSPDLKELGYFSPADWAKLNGADTDLGSTGPAIIAPGILFQIGKDGIGYLVNATSPNGIGGQMFSAKVCQGAYGGTAYSAPYLFVPCTDGLYAVKVSGSTFSSAWQSDQFFAGPPIVTGNLAWTIDTQSGKLYAFNDSDGQQIFTHDLGDVPHFSTAAAGDGRVFAVSDGNRIVSFLISQ